MEMKGGGYSYRFLTQYRVYSFPLEQHTSYIQGLPRIYMGIIHRIAKWILRHDRDEYLNGWHDGVEQQMYDPESCHPIRRDRWLTEQEYWFGIGAEE